MQENFKTFDDWFHHIPEGCFAMTSEYFYSDIAENNANIIKCWLEAAFDAGQNSAKNDSMKSNEKE